MLWNILRGLCRLIKLIAIIAAVRAARGFIRLSQARSRAQFYTTGNAKHLYAVRMKGERLARLRRIRLRP